MLTPLATISKSEAKKGVKRARGADETKLESGCGDALWTPLAQLSADCHVAEISGPSSSSSVMPLPAELPHGSRSLTPGTLVSDRVTAGAFERVVDMLDGAASQRGGAWHARCSRILQACQRDMPISQRAWHAIVQDQAKRRCKADCHAWSSRAIGVYWCMVG